MAKILFRSVDRDEAHKELETQIKKHKKACCTEDANEVIVWDQQPTREEVERATK